MAEDIIHKIEEDLGVESHIPAIDPNTQQAKDSVVTSSEDAAVPAILAGLYKKTRSREGASELISNRGGSIFDLLFGEQKYNVADSVAKYANTTSTEAVTVMQEVADTTRNYVVNTLKKTTPDELINFFTTQRTKILSHLPPELNMGEFLNDPTLDDRTNKMEGPMSNIIHKIEKIFSSSK